MSLVTIILTTLNSEQYVSRSIESCLGQTYSAIELLVVDGGSRDRTVEIVRSYEDPRVRLIHQQENEGKLPGAINIGMANSSGEFITWTQDDCWYETYAIEKMMDFLNQHPEVSLVYADYWDVDESGTRIRYQQVPGQEEILKGDIIRHCFLFRRQVYEEIGPQDEQYFPVHEVPWRIKIAERFRIEPLHLPLLCYTVHSHSLTGVIGPWELQRMTADCLYCEQRYDRSEHKHRLAEIDINHAFDEFVLQGNYRSFWRYSLVGLAGDAGLLLNRGLLKLMAMSLLPVRSRYRDQMYANWLENDAKQQRELSRQCIR